MDVGYGVQPRNQSKNFDFNKYNNKLRFVNCEWTAFSLERPDYPISTDVRDDWNNAKFSLAIQIFLRRMRK